MLYMVLIGFDIFFMAKEEMNYLSDLVPRLESSDPSVPTSWLDVLNYN